MTEVMSQPPQPTPSPHGVTTSMPHQSPQVQQQAPMAQVMPQATQPTQQHGVATSMPPQLYVHPGMQAPPAIAPAPGPQANTTTVSAIPQPLQHQLAPQPLTQPGVPQSPMPQFQQQMQVISQPYIQQVYQNQQGQLIALPAPSMGGTQILPGNNLNNIQVLTAGKAFQGGIAPQMLATTGGKPGVLQTSGQTGCYNPSIPTSGNQTFVIGPVITSQPGTNILSHQNAPKPPGEMQKVGNVQPATFGQMPTGIAWAAPGTLQSPTLLAPPNQQQIVIRGTQPGQESPSLFIHNPMQHMSVPPGSTVLPMATGPQQQQQAKPRTGLETPNIQPKAPTMRPTILPSTPQIRPGASVSTQTATGQMTQMAPRSQAKSRGKNTSRGSPAIAASSQQVVTPSQQAMQQQMAAAHTMPASVAVAPLSALQTSAQIPLSVSTPKIAVSQTTPLDAITNIAQAKPIIATQGAPVRLPNNKLSSVSVATNNALHARAGAVNLVSVPAQLQPIPNQLSAVPAQLQTVPAPVTISSIIPSAAPITPSSVMSVTQSALPTSVTVTADGKSSITTIASSAQQTTTAISGAIPLNSQSTVNQHPQVAAEAMLPEQQPQATPQNGAHVPPAQQLSQLSNKNLKMELKNEPSPKKSVASRAVGAISNSQSNAIATSTTSNTMVSSVNPALNGNTNTPLATSHANTPQCNGLPLSTLKTIDTSPLVNGTGVSKEKPLNPLGQTAVNSDVPKAHVKPQPQVEGSHLIEGTHVVEGHVIDESSKPFPADPFRRSSDSNKRNITTATVAPQAPEKGLDQNDALGKKGEYATCEECNKTFLRSKLKKSKRFCSNTCAKWFNVPRNKRVGYQSSEDSPSKRLKEGPIEENEPQFGQEGIPQFNAEDETSSGEVPLDNGMGELGEMNEGSPSKMPRVDILKWTVEDVHDFIKNLSGCQDYAQDFVNEEIDGQALMLLKPDHLMAAMSIKLGPALKICAKIEEFRSDRKEP